VKDSEDYQLPSEYESIIHSLTLLSSPETAIGVVHYAEMLDMPLNTQLLLSEQHRERVASLPHTSMSEALADSRPIVIISASSSSPLFFTVVDVNEAWVGLCEYSREEALHQNLGDLLQGPETDTNVTQQMMSRLKRDDYSERPCSQTTPKVDASSEITCRSVGFLQRMMLMDLRNILSAFFKKSSPAREPLVRRCELDVSHPPTPSSRMGVKSYIFFVY
jgi:PAS domain-containing protein